MNHAKFVHLHVHSDYSILDGACTVDALIKGVKEHNMPAVALTDHGNMHGVIDFYIKAKEAGIKPVIGTELYVAPRSYTDKIKNEKPFHITLLAKDEKGYANLLILSSLAQLEGFYYKPRIDKELLSRYSEGLIALSGCLHGEVSAKVLSEGFDSGVSVAGTYKEIFGPDNFYIELQNQFLPEQKDLNPMLVDVARRTGLSVVATNDCHYLNAEDSVIQDILLCIQTGATLDDPNRMRFYNNQFYLKSYEEMHELFGDVPGALENTLKVAETCNLELTFGKVHLPKFVLPDGCGMDHKHYLHSLCEEGLSRRYSTVTKEIRERLAFELQTIEKMGFINYFLIVWDFIHFAKNKGIPVGPGRGSAAGSLVSYCLGITAIDPLKYDLLFERFLNPDRVTMPDIDIDFCYNRRGEVIEYVTNKYGKQNVAQIITFGTLGAKAAVRDVGRVMGVPYGDVDVIAKHIPAEPNMTIEKALASEAELADLYNTNGQVKRILDSAVRIEGMIRNVSTHAAGVVISEKPLTHYLPLYRSSNSEIVTQYEMGTLEKIGLLKMDFLGLKTLTVIHDTLKIIERTEKKKMSVDDIPTEDKKTFSLLKKGETIGVFQLESPGMRDLSKRIGIDSINDIIALVALFRPGPMNMLDDFVNRKHGKIRIEYDHPLLEPILRDTYGVMLYQEQVMQCAHELAGFSLAQADILRRIMGKKIVKKMQEQKTLFIEGASAKGINRDTAEKVFEQMAYFAGYGFNKSHSAAYGFVAYITAYLKTHYPVAYMAALLSSEINNSDKINKYIRECLHMGIEILPPDVNQSFAGFTVVGKDIRFGLSAIKNVGVSAAQSIIESRIPLNGFKTLFDFLENLDLRIANRKVLESLIKSGALDGFGYKRRQLFESIDTLLNEAVQAGRDRLNGQVSLFDVFQDADTGFKEKVIAIPEMEEWDRHTILEYEKELLNFYVTGHPLLKYKDFVPLITNCTTQTFSSSTSNGTKRLCGVMHTIKRKTTKTRNEKMAVASLEDVDGSIELLIFPSVYEEIGGWLKEGLLCYLEGEKSTKDDGGTLIVKKAWPLSEIQNHLEGTLEIVLDENVSGNDIEKIRSILTSSREGPPSVTVRFETVFADKTAVSVTTPLKTCMAMAMVDDLRATAGVRNIRFTSAS